jgi:hypothetical protein
VVNSSVYSYQALELLLVENNTLLVQDATMELNRSTVRLARNNWLLLNSSAWAMAAARLNFTDWFTWWMADSAFSAQNSILSLSNVQTWWEASRVDLSNVTVAFEAGEWLVREGECNMEETDEGSFTFRTSMCVNFEPLCLSQLHPRHLRVMRARSAPRCTPPTRRSTSAVLP